MFGRDAWAKTPAKGQSPAPGRTCERLKSQKVVAALCSQKMHGLSQWDPFLFGLTKRDTGQWRERGRAIYSPSIWVAVLQAVPQIGAPVPTDLPHPFRLTHGKGNSPQFLAVPWFCAIPCSFPTSCLHLCKYRWFSLFMAVMFYEVSQILNHCSQRKYRNEFLGASGHIFVNGWIHNFVLCVFLFKYILSNKIYINVSH